MPGSYHNQDEDSIGKKSEDNSPKSMVTLKSLRIELRSDKEDNENIIKA